MLIEIAQAFLLFGLGAVIFAVAFLIYRGALSIGGFASENVKK